MKRLLTEYRRELWRNLGYLQDRFQHFNTPQGSEGLGHYLARTLPINSLILAGPGVLVCGFSIFEPVSETLIRYAKGMIRR